MVMGVLEQVLHVETAAWRVTSLVRDPALVPADAADELYRAFDRIERAAKTAKLLLAKRVEASGAHQRRGHQTAAEYLASVAGGSIGAARDELETSGRLDRCPGTKEALLQGALSPAQGAIIADAASKNPGAERDLLCSAKKTNHKELRQEALRAKAAADADRAATEARIKQGRQLSRNTDAEGAATYVGRGPVTDAALIDKELDALIDVGFADRAPGPLESRSAYAWDALVLMAKYSREHRLGRYAAATVVSAEDTSDGEAPAAPATSRRPKQPPPHWLALLHLDVSALRRGHPIDGERCEIPGVGPISAELARSLLGDAVLKLVISDGIDVLNVTSLTRGPTQAMRYALLWTNPTCSVEGCSRTRIEFDHIWGKEYAKTKHTTVLELKGKCSFHHELHTRHEWELAVGTGKQPIVPPDHPDHPANRNDAPPRATEPLPGTHQPEGTRAPPSGAQPDLFGDAA